MGINNDVHESTKMRPYEVVFGRKCNISTENWLDKDERSTTTLTNEDGAIDNDESSVQFQIRMERPPYNDRPLPFNDDSLPSFSTPTLPTPARAQRDLARGLGTSIMNIPTIAKQPGAAKISKQLSKKQQGKQPLVAAPISSPSVPRVVTTTTTPQAQLEADEQLARQLANEEDSGPMDIDEDIARKVTSAALDTISEDDNISSPGPTSSSSSSASAKSTPGPSN